MDDDDDEEEEDDVRPGPTPPEAADGKKPRDPASGDDDVPSKSKRTAAASRFVDDEADDDGDDDDDDDDDIQYDDVVEIPADAHGDAKDDEYDETPGGYGDDAAYRARDDRIDSDGPRRRSAADDDPRAAAYRPIRRTQPPFSPSSTPLDEPRRILCWNHVGVVTLRGDDAAPAGTGGGNDGNNLVDIAFRETAGPGAGGRRPVTFTDNLGFIVGTLGEEGGMFATDLAEDDDDDDDDGGGGDGDVDGFAGLGVMSAIARKAMMRSRKAKKRAGGGGGGGAGGSSVYFHRFETFGRNADKDWVMALPDGERVLGCATGGGWGAVITRSVRPILRLFRFGAGYPREWPSSNLTYLVILGPFFVQRIFFCVVGKKAVDSFVCSPYRACRVPCSGSPASR